MRRTAVTVAAVAGALLWAPAIAPAAQKPVARTGGAANIAPTSVVLKGRVNPRGADTTYFFQYGTTVLYGGTTAATGAGAGNAGVQMAVPVGALAPATTYHYRLVATNAQGITRGVRRTFRTRRQPLGVSLGATPNPTSAGGSSTLAGVLTGTGNANRQVLLQSNPFPYTQGFLPAANPQVTGADGSFAFPILSVATNTQYRVLMPTRPEIVSPVVVLGTTVKVTRHPHLRRGKRRGRLLIHGRISPAVDGREVLIQRLDKSDGVWVTRAETFARHATDSNSRYRKVIHPRTRNRFRVVVNMNDVYSPSASSSFLVRRPRR